MINLINKKFSFQQLEIIILINKENNNNNNPIYNNKYNYNRYLISNNYYNNKIWNQKFFKLIFLELNIFLNYKRICKYKEIKIK